LWGTLQDRLVSELRLRRIATRDAANAFLPSFLVDFNGRFAQRPASPHAVWRRPPRDLDIVLSCRYARVVARDNTLRLGPPLIQIPRGPHGRSYARRHVEARELLDGRVVVLADGAIIAQQAAPPDFTLAPRRQPYADHARPRAERKRPASSRAVTRALTDLANVVARARRRHPWQRPYDIALALRAGVTLRRG
jgi:hypothetical protein